MSAGGYQRAGVQSRFRAAVNARLEEISFRAGLIAATIALVALSVITAAGVYAATLSLGSRAVTVAAGALSAAGAAKTTPAATASAQPSVPARPQASSTPKARQPVTAATTSPQPAAGSQPWPQAGGAQASSRYYGRAGFSGHASSGGYGSWHGGQGFGFPGRGGRGRP